MRWSKRITNGISVYSATFSGRETRSDHDSVFSTAYDFGALSPNSSTSVVMPNVAAKTACPCERYSANSAVAMEDIATLTMLLPTRIVTSSRWGFDLRSATMSAWGIPSSTIESTRCFGRENSAISEEEKNADIATRKTMATAPSIACVCRSIAGSWRTVTASVVGDKPILTYGASGGN